jgi:hypothetical protein
MLFTSEFPYGTGETFLENEIPLLSNYFDIIIVPAKIDGKKRNVPENVKIRDEFATLQKSRSLIAKIFSSLILSFKFFFEFPFIPISFKAYEEMLAYLSMLDAYSKWFKQYNATNNDIEPAIVYSYWLNAGAFAVAYLKKRFKRQPLFIARAHRFDLYENSSDKKAAGFAEISV